MLGRTKFASDSDTIKRSFIELANLIKMNVLTPSQLADISDLGDVFDYEET